MNKPTKLYLIKSLAPWMMEELISFSTFTTFKLIFLKEVQDFYNNDLEILKKNGIEYHIKPFIKIPNIKDILFAIWTIISHPNLFFKKKSAVWTLHGTFWFLFLDKKLVQNITSVHSQFASQATVISWYLKKRYHIDYYFTFHAHSIYCNNKLFPLVLKDCNTAFSISEFNIRYVEKEYSVSSDKIILARLGLKLPDLKQNIKDEKLPFILGFMSNLEPKKGIPYLLEAFLKLHTKFPGKYELWIAGKGEELPFIESFISSHKMNGGIKILGRIRDQKKIDFFQGIDVFVLPSIIIPNDMDGIPVVLMESIGYGKPIISTNVSGIPEICINDYDGYLIPEKNVDELVKAIEKISSDKEKLKEFSLNSIKLAKRDYDLIKNSENKLKEMKWLDN